MTSRSCVRQHIILEVLSAQGCKDVEQRLIIRICYDCTASKGCGNINFEQVLF